jgi:hypothetical protein
MLCPTDPCARRSGALPAGHEANTPAMMQSGVPHKSTSERSPAPASRQGYDTVLITGTVTNVCCESSARDAMMLNFKTIMVSDANATRTDEEHNATLSTFYAIFGDVMDTDFLIGRLDANAALREAAE